MHLGRRGTEAIALWGVLLGGAAAFDEPLLVVGAATLGAWFLVKQARFGASAAETLDRLEVDLIPTQTTVTTDDEVAIAVEATLPGASPLRTRVESRPPVASSYVTERDGSIDLPPGATEAETTYTVRFPVAGRQTFGRPTVTMTDSDSWFETRRETEGGPTVVVEPRIPRRIHVGAGGDRIAGAFGDHPTGRRGVGLEPTQLRQYVVGDPAEHIDWKATARLREPHVRTFDVETDLRTALVVDHRATTARGPEGETVLDYARQVALSFLGAMQHHRDAAGLYGVGDGGLTVREPPATRPDHYARLRTRLHDLEPTRQHSDATRQHPDATRQHSDATRQHPDATRQRAGGHHQCPPDAETTRTRTQSPADARRSAERLATDDGSFATTLHPFYEATAAYVRRLDSDPLYETVNTEITSLRGSVVTAIVTDDERPDELRETVRLAAHGGNRVVVFLLPSVLFESGRLADLDRAHREYVAFEELRRELARHARVTAYEVAPSDRIEAVLTAGRRRRSSA